MGRVLLTLLLTCKYVSSSHKNKRPFKLPQTACFNTTESFKLSICGTRVLGYCFYLTAPKPSPNISKNTNFFLIIFLFFFLLVSNFCPVIELGQLLEQSKLLIYGYITSNFFHLVCAVHIAFLHSWDSHLIHKQIEMFLNIGKVALCTAGISVQWFQFPNWHQLKKAPKERQNKQNL